MGDTNIDFLKSEYCQYSHAFLSMLLSCCLIPTIDKPTRVHKRSVTLIDNIFVSNPDQVEYSGNIITDITDHFSQFCIIECLGCKLEHLFGNKDNDVNKRFSSFFKKLNRIINKHAPVKSVSKRKLKQLHKPWITRGLKTSIKIKNKLFLTNEHEKYRYYRNKLKILIRASKKQYYFKYFEDNITNMKKTWYGINRLLSRKPIKP